VHRNLKAGEVKVLVETAEDVWCLSQVIDEGDKLKGKTVRKLKTSEEADATKRTVFLAIVVEKLDFGADVLRASGKIVDGPEDVPRGTYHTFSIEPGATVEIVKQHWYQYQLDRLDEQASAKRAKILVCVFDREDAYFALLKGARAEVLAHITGEVERKRMAQAAKKNFYEEIIAQLQEYDKRFELDFIVVASPAFWKEELQKVLKDEALRKKLVQATCSSVDEQAIDEVLRRDEVRAKLAQERVSREQVAVDKLLGEIAKKGSAVYGFKETQKAADAGAVEQLLVTDALIKKLRSEQKFAPLDALMRSVDKQKGTITIVSSEHAGGRRLDGLGGIAALLRYKLSYE